MASRTGVELQHLQHSFISTLISSAAAKSGGNQSHSALYAYATKSLAYHVRAALSPPFELDSLAASLLLHSDPSIVVQVLAGVNCADVDALAEQFEQADTESGNWSACRLYYSIAIGVAGLGFV